VIDRVIYLSLINLSLSSCNFLLNYCYNGVIMALRDFSVRGHKYFPCFRNLNKRLYSATLTTKSTPSYTLHSSSSMESPPEVYMRNAGICLINSSKKVYIYVFCISVLFICSSTGKFIFLVLGGRFLELQGWVNLLLGKCRR
jgi:hypothetical protein